MANIFSGMFANRGRGAANLAQFNSDLEAHQNLMEYQKRNEALMATDAKRRAAQQGMSPERNAIMEYQRSLAGQEGTGEMGMTGLETGFKQRGTTIADILKQEKNTLESNLRHQYKVDNPIAGDANKKIEFLNHMEKLYGKDSGEYERALKALRQEQFLEQEDRYVSTVDNTIVSKRLLEGGITKALVPEYKDRLSNFFPHIDDSEDLLLFSQNRRDDIQKLSEETDGWTTGLIGLALSTINPSSEAADWVRLKDTIVSNIGLSEIMRLKASSAQGATGLGALNERELEMLQNHAGTLKIAADPAELKRILRRLDRDLKGMQKRMMKALKREETFYNDYKQYLPHAAKGDPIWAPPEESKHLFTGGDYIRPEIASPLDEPDDIDSLLDKYAPLPE